MAKYTLTDETIIHEGRTLHRVRYSDGTLGGWIENESNLSQEGDARLLDQAKVFGNSEVTGDSLVLDSDVIDSRISDSTVYYSRITDSQIIKSDVLRSVIIYSRIANSQVNGHSQVDNSQIRQSVIADYGEVLNEDFARCKVFGTQV